MIYSLIWNVENGLSRPQPPGVTLFGKLNHFGPQAEQRLGWPLATARLNGFRPKVKLVATLDAVCNPHAALSISFPLCCLMMWHATHTLHHLFYSLHIVDDAMCNPHTALSISFSLCCLIMWHATHMLCHLFLSLYVV